jgi:imidazolonepropionase
LDADIPYLRGSDMRTMGGISEAWIYIEDGVISSIGSMKKPFHGSVDERIDASGSLVLPAYCDSHTHLVFAETREKEFAMRIEGISYEEIAQAGGGILNSVEKLRNFSEEELYKRTLVHAKEVIAHGTGCIEVKSGYGLDLESEVKILRVARRIGKETPLNVKTTFLGAHAFPKEYSEDIEGYVDLIINEMIPAVAKEGLADYIDVFCERGYFDKHQMERILLAGKEYGMRPKVHVNQFSSIGGVQMAIKNEALSADHLEVMTDHDIEDISSSETIATALPACSFFLDIPYTPAEQIMANGGILALATDFNPGSSPCPNMNFVMSLACIRMGMTPLQALAGCTINGAAAMELSEHHGSITPGKKADLIITTPMRSLAQLPYSFATDPIAKVMLNGSIVHQRDTF